MNPAASGPGEDAWPADAVEVGVIAGAWGVRGGFKVLPHATEPQALFASKRWWLQAADGSRRLLRITSAREQGDAVVAGAQDLGDRDAAQALRGARVFVARSSFPTAGADEYYWVDLIGLAVVNRQGVALGTVADLIDTGAHSVLRVQPAAERDGEPGERLIPFVAAYVDRVDLPARRIEVDWGLDY
jgi:16S rRNA processing protein RimM